MKAEVIYTPEVKKVIPAHAGEVIKEVNSRKYNEICARCISILNSIALTMQIFNK